MKRLLPVIIILLLPCQLLGQDANEMGFSSYSRADGLTHNTISGITQDSAGYIWISTPAGLNRYNGSRFVQFHSNGNEQSLPAEEINGMAWLDKSSLAIFTAGLHIIDTKTGKTRNLYIPYKDKQYEYKFNMIVSVTGNEEGEKFVLSRSGFYHFSSTDSLLSRFDYYTELQVKLDHFSFGRELIELDDNRFMINSIGGIYIYDRRTRKAKLMSSSDAPVLGEFVEHPDGGNIPYRFFQTRPGCLFAIKLDSDSIYYIDIIKNVKKVSRVPIHPLRNEFQFRSRMLRVSDSIFYITGHFSGFFKIKLDPLTGNVTLDSKKYFPSYLCNMLFQDRDNNLWVATNKGVLHQDKRNSRIQLCPLPTYLTDAFPDIKVDDIQVGKNKIYAAARSQGGLLIFDKKTFRFEKQVLFKRQTEKANLITSLATLDSANLLVGTGAPLLQWNMNTGKEKVLTAPRWGSGDWTSDLSRDSKGNIWISAYSIYCYNPATLKFKVIPANDKMLNVPASIEEDRDGNIWMAGHGLTRYNTRLSQFDLLLDTFPYLKMPDKQVNAMVIDEQNTVWFNSNNNGLLGYSINTGKYRHITRSDGLPDDNISSMIVVGNKLWIAFYSGIACMDLSTLKVVLFGKEDGFPDMPVSKGARFYYDENAQQLYMSFTSAIARFNPYEILATKSPPHVFIESVNINEKQTHFLPPSNITTSWRDNEFQVMIGSINFSDNYSQRFAYRVLKIKETAWQHLGTQSSFNLSNLSPGKYRVQVKCYSLHNRWPEQIREFQIEVLPPFWMKEWFIGVVVVLAIFLFYLLIKWRTGIARKKEMEKTNTQKLKADDYKSQFELEQISNYFSSSLTGKNTQEEVLWDVANNLIRRLDYVDCMIYLWDDDQTKMVQNAAYGPKGQPQFLSANVFEVVPVQGVVGHVMQTLQPVLLRDTRLDSRYRVDEEFRLSEVCVPIIHNGELLGIIDSEHYEVDYFRERDIKILTTIATLIGNKLKQLESERSLEDKRQELANINEQLAEARLEALQAQMNPHFVFNALNSIKRMILDGENEKASRYLSKFALMIRMTLDHSKDTFVTLDENIAYLNSYLEMEQLRFNDSFTYLIQASENIDTGETSIPSLMIQPLAENAIWHGLMHAGTNKRLKINFTKEDQKITCVIEDNGIGIHESEQLKKLTRPLHRSTGLDNLQRRIKIMNEKYRLDCSLQITDLKDTVRGGNGTKAILRFNIINV